MQNNNPFFEEFTLPYDAIPFSKIKPEHFLPAVELGIQLARENIKKITDATEAATFANTIEALESCSDKLGLVADVFSSLKSTEGTDEMQKLAPQVYGRMTELSSEISLNEHLFAKVKVVHDQTNKQQLSVEQNRLLEKTYKDFVRNGALLSAEKKERLRAIDLELSALAPKFSENVLRATQKFELPITEKSQLRGLPESLIEALAQKGQERKKSSGWLLSLDAPLVMPFLQFSDVRDLREKAWRAYSSRAYGGEFDNTEVAKKIARLKFERAQLLGYASHAHYVLEERMAQGPEKVRAFLDRLYTVSRPAGEREMQELREFAVSLGGPKDLMPWDFSYYNEKLRQKKFDIDPEKLREYFPFDNVVKGAFDLASRLYELKFEEIHDVDIYHPEVKVYRVSQKSDGKYLGLLYTDFFPRSTKSPGAWCTGFREQGLCEGKVQRPHAVIVGSFSPATATRPSLLTFDEVNTLFHEFGHALHSLLSDCRYRSIAGHNVYWDFVELPSQFMENWALEREVLDMISSHYQTGAKLPEDYTKKLRDESKFSAGFHCLRQLSFALLDLAWYGGDPSGITDLEKIENEAMGKTRLLPAVPGMSMSASFSHIFGGGYAAGYYSYKWAEVLDADAFEFFKTDGLFNPEVAKKFRAHILSRGGSEHPMDLYVKFRGREPDPNALLKRSGLIS